MRLVLELAAGALAGAALGLLFFGTLWATVVRLPRSRRPALLAAAGFCIRMIVLAGGFLLIMSGDWRKLLAAAAGLLIARRAFLHRLAPTGTATEMGDPRCG